MTTARTDRTEPLAKRGAIIAFAVGACLPAFQPMALAQTTSPAPVEKTQPAKKLSETEKAFYKLIVGPWAQITPNARKPIVDDQLTIAALQCRAARNVDPDNAATIKSISKSISQKLSKLIIYQKVKTGLNRIDIGNRNAILFTKLKTGKIRNGKPGFTISGKRGKITLAFAKLKMGNRTTPVMIEGKALFLKCPVRKK